MRMKEGGMKQEEENIINDFKGRSTELDSEDLGFCSVTLLRSHDLE